MTDFSMLSDEELMQIAGSQDALADIPDSELETIVSEGERARGLLPETLNFAGYDTGIPLHEDIAAGLIGMGKTGVDIGRGVSNWFSSDAEKEQIAQQAAEEEAIYSPLAGEFPVATGIGEATPYLATAAIPGGLAAQMGVGGAVGSLEYDQDQLRGAAEGAIYSGIGYGLGTMGGRVLRAIGAKGKQTASRVTQATQKVVKGQVEGLQDVLNVKGIGYQVNPKLGKEAVRLGNRADEIGLVVTPAQKSGERPMQILEASAKSNPLTAGVFDEVIDNNRMTLNRLAARSIGEEGEHITPMMLGDAAERIGKVYDDAAKAVDNFKLDEDVILETMENMGADAQRYLDNYVRRFPGFDQGKMTGKEFMAMRNAIAKDIRSAWGTGNGAVAEDLVDIQAILHTSLEKASPSASMKLKAASKQWKNLKALESGGALDARGNINTRTLANRLKRLDKSGFARGRNTSDYYDSLRISNQFADVVGTSGTAERLSIPNMMANPIQSAAGYASRPLWRSYTTAGGTAAGELLTGSPVLERAGSVIGRMEAADE